jgi:ribosomal protein S18 acetylase RimI-like enzyme
VLSAFRAQEDDLPKILDLQRANLARNLSPEEIASQGFVTVEHTLPILQRMHAIEPSIVIRDADTLAGYAIVMPPECRAFVPILDPMFARLERLGVGNFYVMGQVCVARDYRGRGVFDLLFRAHREHLRAKYDRSVTEIATRNVRSMRAHERVGFRVIDRYRDETDDWAIVAWDWS